MLTNDAIVSADGIYRYQLQRRWMATSADVATFLMLNPSTADARIDDPTIRKCVGFARRWGLDGIRVVNLFALRSTDPKGLLDHADPVGPENDEHLAAALAYGGLIVAAWGSCGNGAVKRLVRDRLVSASRCMLGRLQCLAAGQKTATHGIL